MWTLIFLLFVAHQAAAETLDCGSDMFEKCTSESQFSIEFPESEEDINAMCPTFTAYLECARRYNEACYGKKGFRVLDPGHYESIRDLARDICSDTLLHEVLVNNIDCMASRYKKYNEVCEEPVENATQAAVNKIRSQANAEGREINDEEMRLTRCLPEYFGLGCLFVGISEKCGKIARDAAMEVIERSMVYLPGCNDDFMDNLKALVEVFEMDIVDGEIVNRVFFMK